MRESKTCPKCKGTKIGYLDHLVDWDRGVVPRRLAQGRIGRMTTYGKIEAYVCTTCGFFEEYVADPKEVPWANLQGFRWVSSDDDADGG
ncbi:MAG: hypothetical protein ACI8S6_003435 [Myxococcota bacterium]|jgi:hypothetical protein